MCTHRRIITNKYTGQDIVVSCGKCESCQQEKANSRAARIRRSLAPGEICLFITLTYKNEFVPYIDLRYLKDGSNHRIPIFRHRHGRFVRTGVGSDYSQSFVVDYKNIDTQIDVVKSFHVNMSTPYKRRVAYLKHLRKAPEYAVGVCYYPDLQRFYKRLRQNLIRKYNYYGSFKTFSCSEYGSQSQRPHFHALLFIPQDSESVFRRAIVESWPYADTDRTSKFIEIARDAASYVASYVNGNNALAEILSTPNTRPKHSYSKDFGMSISDFSLDSVLRKVSDGDLSFCSIVYRDGISEKHNIPIPKYVISRYFPEFKGSTRLSIDSLVSVLRCPSNLGFCREYRDLGYTLDDWSKINVRLKNSYKRYFDLTGKNSYDYAIDYVSTWNCFRSNSIRRSYDDIFDISGYLSFYDNIDYFLDDMSRSISLSDMCRENKIDVSLFERDFNKIVPVVCLSNSLTEMYYRKTKQKDVTNLVMSEALCLDV